MNKRVTSEINVPPIAIGTRSKVLVHEFFPSEEVKNLDRNSLEYYSQERVYIQAGLHADELPGILVANHLVKMLDKAAEEGRIRKQISIVPYANPIGLNQIIQGSHFGRFSLLSGINFNRNWLDLTQAVAQRVEKELKSDDLKGNTAIIRKALYDEAASYQSNKSEAVWKRELYKRACVSSVVIDLHCDSDATMHTYTHDRLWPQVADLCASIGSECNLISGASGGNPFDEAYSCPWANLMDKFPNFPIEMGCQSATIELRGEADVYDHFAEKDAAGLYAFLVRRGFIEDQSVQSIDISQTIGLPFAGVDMVEATAPGVIAWKVKSGDTVTNGQLLGEIVNIEDIDAPRIPIYSRTSGYIYALRNHKLAVPGDPLIKVAGKDNLDWRTGNLLTAK